MMLIRIADNGRRTLDRRGRALCRRGVRPATAGSPCSTTSNKGDWNEVGKANWEMKDGVLTADKLDGKDLAYLVSKVPYKDFQIYAEFWVDEEANSGIFIRCEKPDSDRWQELL